MTGRATADAAEREDLALLARVAEGNREAFERLYRRYAPRLARFLARTVRDPQAAEEALNDTLVVLWQKAGAFEPRARLSTWLFGIAHRKALHARRQAARRGAVLPAESAPERSAPGPDPERELLAREEGRALSRALGELSEEQRAVVELTFVEGCSYAEIAEILDCPVNTVKTRMHHARRRLGRTLQRPAVRLVGGAEDER